MDVRAGPQFRCGHDCHHSLFQEEEAKKLVSEAIAAGIFNDLGSGSNIDLCVISKSKLDFLRPYSVPNKKGTRSVEEVGFFLWPLASVPAMISLWDLDRVLLTLSHVKVIQCPQASLTQQTFEPLFAL